MVDVAMAAALLEDIAVQQHRLEEIRDRFNERVNEPNSLVARAVNWMLGYMLVEASDLAGRRRHGAAFAPIWESKQDVFPPYLDKLPDRESIVAIWEDLALHVRHPVIKGRVSDLLWCVGSGSDRHRHARTAVDSYLSAAVDPGVSEPDTEQLHDAVLGLDRALELSLDLNAHDLQAQVRDRIADLLRWELQSKDAATRPGLWMRLLATLVGLNAEERPTDLGELVAGAHALASDRTDIRLALFQMQEQLASGKETETRSIRRSAVAMLLLEARRQEHGLSRQHWFQEAFDLAREKGMGRRTERRIRRAMQQIDPGSFDWQEHGYALDISGEEVEQWIDELVGNDALESALVRFALLGGPPTGNRAETERTVDDLARRFVFQQLFARFVMDERGYQVRRIEGPEDKRSLDILEHEAHNIQFDGALRQFALDRISECYPVESASLRRLFHTTLIDEAQADGLARAFEHFWADRPDEALLVGLPRIEAVLRTLLDLAGGLVYQPPRNQRLGRVVGMGEVLRGLEERLTDEETEWFRFFRIALTEPTPGLNLRNRHVHGLAEQAVKQDAAIVLRIAALLRLVKVEGR